MVLSNIIKEVSEQLLAEELKVVSPQQAHDQKLFGPVYHGTTSDKLEKISTQGFNVFVGHERSGDVSQGYEASDYSGGIPAPIHHLGFGVYFTTVKSIAKRFGYGNTQLGPYFLNAPNMITINFGSPRTMMKWWIENGYDYKNTPETTFGSGQTSLSAIRQERLRATTHMTEFLKARYDGVWFKGKGMYRLLDGDQVVMFNPSKIYKLDKNLAQPGEIGSRVVSKVGIDPYGRGEIKVPIGTKGIIIDKKKPNEFQKWAAGSEWIYHIKWDKGGQMYGVLDSWIEPYVRSTKKPVAETEIVRRDFWKIYENSYNKTLGFTDINESDEEHGKALQQTGYWGKQGAGAIILAQDTGRILLPYRSRSVEQPHTWGVWGGAIDAGEDPAGAVRREISEEVGYSGLDMKLIPMYVYRDPRVDFQYSNFLAVVPKEFSPKLNWETENYRWVTFGEWPTPLHFGLKALLQNSGDDIFKEIQKRTIKSSQPKQPKPMDKAKYNAAIDVIRRTWGEMARGGDYKNRFDYDNSFIHWMQNTEPLQRLVEKYGQQFYPGADEPGFEFQNDVESILEMLETKLNQRRASKINKDDPLYFLKQVVRGRTWNGAKQALSHLSWLSRGHKAGQISDDLAEGIFNKLYRISHGETFYEKSMYPGALYLDKYILTAESPAQMRIFIHYYNGRNADRFPKMVKVYRGLNSPAATIRPGDHVSLDKAYVRSYEAGKLGTVISSVMPSEDLLTTRPEPEHSELIYWPAGHQIKKVENVPTFRQFYNQWAFP